MQWISRDGLDLEIYDDLTSKTGYTLMDNIIGRS